MKIIIDTDKFMIKEKLTKRDKRLKESSPTSFLTKKVKGIEALLIGTAVSAFKSYKVQESLIDLIAKETKQNLGKAEVN